MGGGVGGIASPPNFVWGSMGCRVPSGIYLAGAISGRLFFSRKYDKKSDELVLTLQKVAKKSHRRTDNIAGDPSPVRVLSQR